MITQLMAFAAIISLGIFIVLYSILLAHTKLMKKWQFLASFLSAAIASAFIALYIAMSWPDSGKPPAYRYVPVQEQLYRFERIVEIPDSVLSTPTGSVIIDTIPSGLSISDTLLIISKPQ